MKVKAAIGFSGQVSAAPGEVLDLPGGSPVLADLLRAGYVEPVDRAAPRKPGSVQKEAGT